MTLDGFSSCGITPMAFTTYSKIYPKTLEYNLLPYFYILTMENSLFQQHNATYHQSALTRRWFTENNIKIPRSQSYGESLVNIGKGYLQRRKTI